MSNTRTATVNQAVEDYQSIIDITRPPITAQSLDLSSVNRQDINADGTFDCLIIPLKCISNDSKEWNAFQYDDMWEYLMSNYGLSSDEAEKQTPNLYLYIDDSYGDRQYGIGTTIQFSANDETDKNVLPITLNADEQAIITQAIQNIIMERED